MVHRDHRQYERSWSLSAGARRTLCDAQIMVWKGWVRTMKYDYAQCRTCGWVGHHDYVEKCPDPTATDGTLDRCPDCGEVDELSELTLVTQQDPARRTWFAHLMNRKGEKMTPTKFGLSEKEAVEALVPDITY